jgi:GT2 family glycosyltransferase
VKVSGVFVVTGPGEAELLGTSLPGLHAQVDELVVVANGPRSRPAGLPDDVRVVENDRALGFSTNVNKGIVATSGEYVVISNPDAVPEPDCVRGLVSFADAHPRCGIAGPKMINPDGTLQASRRSFPTVGGTIVRRTPLRSLFPPLRWQRRHYLLDAPADEPLLVDTMLGAFLLMRRTMLDEIGGWDAGYKLYVEDIDWCLRMHQRGWRVVYVPQACVTHHHLAVTDHRWLTWRTAVHARGMLRFLVKHGVRPTKGSR